MAISFTNETGDRTIVFYRGAPKAQGLKDWTKAVKGKDLKWSNCHVKLHCRRISWKKKPWDGIFAEDFCKKPPTSRETDIVWSEKIGQ